MCSSVQQQTIYEHQPKNMTTNMRRSSSGTAPEGCPICGVPEEEEKGEVKDLVILQPQNN